MAYAYNAIDDLIQGNQKQDIFAQQGGQQSQNGMPQNQDQVKTSTEGEVHSGGQASTSPVAQQQSASPPAGDPNTAARAAYKANEGKTGQPAAIGNVQSQLQANSQRLQDEANKYVSSQEQNQHYGVDRGSLDKAITGDQEASGRVHSLFNAAAPTPAEEFKPTDVNVSDVNKLNTSAGLQDLVARGQGPQYTQGMGAFDVRALRSSPNFQNLMNMIQSQQTGLQKQATDLGAQKKQEVEEHGQNALTQAQKDAQTYLGSQSDAISKANAEEARVANQKLEALRNKGDPVAEKHALEQAKAQVLKNLQQSDPRTAAILNGVSVDPRQFGKAAQNYSANDFVSSDEAQRFNNIMGLLGNGGQSLNASNPVGPSYSLDQTGLQNALTTAAQQKRNTLDTGFRSREQVILDAAQARADAADKARAGLNLQSISNEQAQAALRGLSPDLQKYYQSGLVDPNQYISRPDVDLSAKDVLNQDEVKKLNDLNKALGMQGSYGVGQYADKTPGYDFNKQGYLAALMPYLKQSQQAVAERAAEEARKTEAWNNRPPSQVGSLMIETPETLANRPAPINMPGPGFTFVGEEPTVMPGKQVRPTQPGQLLIPGLNGGYY